MASGSEITTGRGIKLNTSATERRRVIDLLNGHIKNRSSGKNDFLEGSAAAAKIVQGIQSGKIKVFNRLPDGWKLSQGATTAPRGYVWVSNNQSYFGGKREKGLISESNFKKSTF